MLRDSERLCAIVIAAAMCMPALAQDYRYPGADDAARQSTSPSAQSQPAQPPVQQQVQQPLPPQPAAAVPAPAQCVGCGTVDSIRIVEKAGEGSGVGMVAGGLLGGLLGHQIGQGRGNTAATIVGAAGGAYAGHQVEKNVKKVTHYDVVVRMDDGTQRAVSYEVEPGFRAGDRVRYIDGKFVRL